MKDVLSNLAKLPPSCFAVIDGQVVVIRRGARDPAPAVGISREEAGKRNAAGGVTDAQVRAMIAGVTLGWDMDAADPDYQAPDEPLGDELFEYTFVGDIELQIRVTARNEELAVKQASMIRQTAADLSTEDDSRILSAAPSSILDLIDTNDPRP
jgi:hypothetical protein